MHFLRESLASLPTISSLEERYGGVDNPSETLAKWKPKEARKSNTKLKQSVLSTLETIKDKIGGNIEEKKEPSKIEDPFICWVADEYHKLSPEKQQDLKKEIISAVTRYM